MHRQWPSVNLASIAWVVFGLPGCLSISSLQTAHPMEPGSFGIFGAVGLQSFNPSEKLASVNIANHDLTQVPLVELGARYGITEEIDSEIKVTAPGVISLLGRYNVFHRQNFAITPGLSYGTGAYSFGSDQARSVFTINEVSIPVFVSYDVTDYFSVFSTPRILHRFVDEEGVTEAESDGGVFAATLGVSFFGIMLEGGWFRFHGTEQLSAFQVTFGYSASWDRTQYKKRSEAIGPKAKAKAKAGTKAKTKSGTKAGTKAKAKAGTKAKTKSGTKSKAETKAKAGTSSSGIKKDKAL